jgi:hypothetical protein
MFTAPVPVLYVIKKRKRKTQPQPGKRTEKPGCKKN